MRDCFRSCVPFRCSGSRSPVKPNRIPPSSVLWGAMCLLGIAMIATTGRAIAEDAEGKDDSQQVELTGRLVDEQKNPVEGVLVEARYYDGTSEAKTDTDGRFRLSLPDRSRLRFLFLLAASADRTAMATQTLLNMEYLEPPEDLTLEWKPSVRIEVRVVDAEGEPVAEARVGAEMSHQYLVVGTTSDAGNAVLAIPADRARMTLIHAVKASVGMDYIAIPSSIDRPDGNGRKQLETPLVLSLTGARPLRVAVRDAETDLPIVGAKVYPVSLSKERGQESFYNRRVLEGLYALTDENGEATLDWLPTWNAWPRLALNVDKADYRTFNAHVPHEEDAEPVTVKLDRLIPLRGRVVFADGRPAAGIQINASGSGPSRDGSRIVVSSRNFATTDDDGRYELMLPPYQAYLVAVNDQQWAAEPRSGFTIMPGPPVEEVDFVLRPTTRVFGRITAGPEKDPIPQLSILLWLNGEHSEVQYVNERGETRQLLTSARIHSYHKTNEEGEFEFFVGPGTYTFRGPAQAEQVEFEIGDETEQEINIHAPRPDRGQLTGLVLTGDPPRPVPQARIEGVYRYNMPGQDLTATTNNEGQFIVERELHRTVLCARSEDGRLAGVVEIGPDEKHVQIDVEPTASLIGRILDRDGQPAEGQEISYGIKVPAGDDNAPWRVAFGGTVNTDADGRYELTKLVVGQSYCVNVTMDRGVDGLARSWRQITTITPDSAEEPIDLGEYTLEPTPTPLK